MSHTATRAVRSVTLTTPDWRSTGRTSMTLATAGQDSTIHLQELLRAYRQLRKPFGAQGVLRFTAIYMRLYPTLSPAEQRHADALATRFKARLEDHSAGAEAGYDP